MLRKQEPSWSLIGWSLVVALAVTLLAITLRAATIWLVIDVVLAPWSSQSMTFGWALGVSVLLSVLQDAFIRSSK